MRRFDDPRIEVADCSGAGFSGEGRGSRAYTVAEMKAPPRENAGAPTHDGKERAAAYSSSGSISISSGSISISSISISSGISNVIVFAALFPFAPFFPLPSAKPSPFST